MDDKIKLFVLMKSGEEENTINNSMFELYNEIYDIHIVEENRNQRLFNKIKKIACNETKPFIVTCNLDIKKSQLDKMCEIHNNKNSIITLACKTNVVEIPFEAIDTDNNGRLCSTQKNPRYTFLENLETYVINPEALEYVPDNKEIGLNEIMRILATHKKEINTFMVY